MNHPTQIRAARPEDAEAIETLIAASGLPLQGLRESLDHALVAEADGAVVGVIALEVYADGALLRSAAVRPEYRGRQVGHALTRSAVDLARQLGLAGIYLLTETAIDFFPRFGFGQIPREAVPAGVRQSVEFTSVCPVSATVMALSLQ